MPLLVSKSHWCRCYEKSAHSVLSFPSGKTGLIVARASHGWCLLVSQGYMFRGLPRLECLYLGVWPPEDAGYASAVKVDLTGLPAGLQELEVGVSRCRRNRIPSEPQCCELSGW